MGIPEAELSWSLQDSPLEGEAGDGKEGEQTSLLRLELSDNSTGLYHCHASNSLGEGSCHLELTESMLTVGLELRIVIIVVIVVGILLLMVLLCYLYHRRNKAGIKGGVEWYNVHHHSFRREGDVAKVKGSVDLSLILEERDCFQ